jgi:hypothetical protein
MSKMSFDEWLAFGQSQKWCSGTICVTHEGVPMTDSEETEWEDGNDFCQHVLRLYETPEDFDNVAAQQL